jgi:hypothetical protein
MSFYRLTNDNQLLCSLKKKARKITAAQYKAKRILSVYAEPCGLCAKTSPMGTSDRHNTVMGKWQSPGEDA